MKRRVWFWIMLAWGAICLMPYPWVGENWGYSWMLLNYPLSIALQGLPLLNIGYPYLLIACVTSINGCIYGWLAHLLVLGIRYLARKSK